MNASDPLGKVATGDRRRISARTWNLLVDAAKEVIQGGYGGTAPPLTRGPLPAVTLLVRNDSGADRSRGDVLRLAANPTDGSPLISYASVPYEAQREPLPKGTTPAAAGDPFAVLAEPVPAGKFGRAAVGGLAVCTVNVTDATHTHAQPTPGDCTRLTSAVSGAARILLRESGTGNKVAVVWLADHYGYAGEAPAGTYWDGLLSTTTQALKGNKVFRDDSYWVASPGLTAPGLTTLYTRIGPGFAQWVYPNSAVSSRGVISAQVASSLSIASSQFNDPTTGRGGSVSLFAQATSVALAFGSPGRVGMSGTGVMGLCVDGGTLTLVRDLDNVTGTASQTSRYAVVRYENNTLVQYFGIDHDFASGEYPKSRGGINVGVLNAAGQQLAPGSFAGFAVATATAEFGGPVVVGSVTVTPSPWGMALLTIDAPADQVLDAAGGADPYTWASASSDTAVCTVADTPSNPPMGPFQNTVAVTPVGVGVATVTTVATDTLGNTGVATAIVVVSAM